MPEVGRDPHLFERGIVREVDYPERGTVKVIGNPIKLGADPAKTMRRLLAGATVADPSLLQRASKKQIAMRMLQNLHGAYLRRRDFAKA
jgi:crotonobetainyl-CoA:carnitine CoA-transferase CaiB-like acyl-CoA transferase